MTSTREISSRLLTTTSSLIGPKNPRSTFNGSTTHPPTSVSKTARRRKKPILLSSSTPSPHKNSSTLRSNLVRRSLSPPDRPVCSWSELRKHRIEKQKVQGTPVDTIYSIRTKTRPTECDASSPTVEAEEVTMAITGVGVLTIASTGEGETMTTMLVEKTSRQTCTTTLRRRMVNLRHEDGTYSLASAKTKDAVPAPLHEHATAMRSTYPIPKTIAIKGDETMAIETAPSDRHAPTRAKSFSAMRPARDRPTGGDEAAAAVSIPTG